VKIRILTTLVGVLVCAPSLVGLGELTGTSITPERSAFEIGMPVEPPSYINGADEAVQYTWAKISELARHYADLDEEKLLAAPGITEKEDLFGGKVLRVVTKDPAGVETEFKLGRDYGYLLGVRALRPDGVTVGVNFKLLLEPERLGVESGYTIDPGGMGHIEIDFDSTLRAPRLAISYENASNDGKGSAKVLAWSSNGKIIVDRVLIDVNGPHETRRALLDSMTNAEFDALEIPYGGRLRSSPAYQNAERQLKRALENAVGWSEKLIYAVPETLIEDLKGDEIVRREEDETFASYKVNKNGRTLWTVDFGSPNGNLNRAVHSDGHFQLYYDYHNNTVRLVGAIAPVKKIGVETTYWLVSFYPGQFTPRMALAAAGSPPDGLLAHGALHVWDREGALLVDRSNQEPTAIETALGEIESALADAQRADIGWRGAAGEAAALSGRE